MKKNIDINKEDKMYKHSKLKKFIPLFILGGIGIFFLVGWLVQLLWNSTVTVIFDSNPIGYWQGIMLVILSKILFSSHYNIKKHHRPHFVEHRLFKKEKHSEAEEKEEE